MADKGINRYGQGDRSVLFGRRSSGSRCGRARGRARRPAGGPSRSLMLAEAGHFALSAMLPRGAGRRAHHRIALLGNKRGRGYDRRKVFAAQVTAGRGETEP